MHIAKIPFYVQIMVLVLVGDIILFAFLLGQNGVTFVNRPAMAIFILQLFNI